MPAQSPSAATLTRPFSPSPPRENRHTASRPPSMLFGAPARGSAIIAEASSADVAGLPPTPAVGQAGPSHAQYGYFGMMERQQGSSGIDDVFGETARSPRRTPRKMKRDGAEAMYREGSSSSGSSASPPLGAASLLSAIVSTQHVSQTSRSQSPASSFRSRRSDAPTPSSTNRQSASPGRDTVSVPSPQSIPRIHQPTVVRTKSGRGLTFLPPPAELSTSQSSFSLRQPSLSGLSPRSETPPRNTAAASKLNSPLPSPGTHAGHQRPGRDLSGSASATPSSGREATGAQQPTYDSVSASRAGNSGPDRAFQRAGSEDEEHITLHEISEPETASKLSFEMPSVPASELPDPLEEVRKALHSVEPTRKPAAKDTHEVSKQTGRTYDPPYKVRAKAKKATYVLEDTSESTGPDGQDSRLAITIYASLSRRGGTSVALPNSGLELDFSWSKQGWLAWIPGGWLVPQSVGIKRLGSSDKKRLATQRREELGLIRGAVQGVLLRLPIVWRFASWV